MASVVVFLPLLLFSFSFLSLLVAVRGVCSRGERYSHFFFFFFPPNAPARVTNFRQPAGLAVILADGMCSTGEGASCEKGELVNTCEKGELVNTCEKGELVNTCEKGELVNTCEKGELVNTCKKGKLANT